MWEMILRVIFDFFSSFLSPQKLCTQLSNKREKFLVWSVFVKTTRHEE